MTVQERLTEGVGRELREVIREAGGNEVFLVGHLDRQGRVTRVVTAARGSAEAVPALSAYAESGDVVIHNHPSGNLTPSEADFRVASRLGAQGIGFYIVDNPVRNVYVVAEPVALAEVTPLPVEELAGHLLAGGSLDGQVPDFEERESQVEMLRFVCSGFNRTWVCLAEAGTGVGKSLAYLLPAARWVIQNGQRVVITTATINLQQQLIEKDIPLVVRMLGRDPGACLVKGRGNYLCRTRLGEALEELDLFAEEDEELRGIAEWGRATATGDRSDLPFYVGEELWSRVCSEADACGGLRCLNREGCFVLRARREAAASRLLVTNHHLLFSDLAMRLSGSGFEGSAVLPPFQHIVFDEAHNLERSATSYFSESFSRPQIAKYAGRLLRRRKGREAGLLPGLARMGARGPAVAGMRRSLEEIGERAETLDCRAVELLDGTAALRIDEQGLSALRDPLHELAAAIATLGALFEEVLEEFSEQERESTVASESRLQLRRLLRVAELCRRLERAGENPQEVCWLEARRGFQGERFARLVVTPLDIAPLMREAVYEPYGALVFTSATLTVAGSFEYWKSRLGLTDTGREPWERIFPSPFDYERNVLLAIPSDAPTPDSEGYAGYVAEALKELLSISEGRALVLFTSYAALEDAARAIQQPLAEQGIPLLRQGQEDRHRLLGAFVGTTGSVLLATDSFWEGVDAPGEALEVVVLVRLPFHVPTDPVLQARMEAIRRRGGEPFWQLSLPDAIIRLRQGFGRLMRRQTDHGAVVILDSRIVSRSYGSYFLSSLPPARRVIAATAQVSEAFENFIVAMRQKKGSTDVLPPPS